jgi:hypothetical protein
VEAWYVRIKSSSKHSALTIFRPSPVPGTDIDPNNSRPGTAQTSEGHFRIFSIHFKFRIVWS